MMATAQHCPTPATLDRLKRLVQQRTACLDAVRAAYVRDVLSVKLFLQQKQRVERDAGVASMPTSMLEPLAVPEEINRAPSADLRHLYRDMAINHDAGADAHATTAGGGREIPHPTVPRAGLVDAVGVTARDAEEEQELEAKVQDLSFGVYAPSSHALVIKPCQACLGVATFIVRRNQRVEEALTRLDRTERLEEEVAAVSATNASLLDRLLPAEAKLELAAERLKKAHGFGKGGRDWLVKELARVVKDASTLKANGLKREQAVLEGNRRMDRERRKLKEEGEAATARFRAQLSEAKEGVERLKEALLQSNADTRREATKAAKLEKEAFSLGATVKRIDGGLRDRGRLLAAANRRAAEAGKEAVLLRECFGAAKEGAVEKELAAGNRLHEAELALEAEEAQTRHLTAKLDDANAKIVSLHERVAGVTAAAEMGQKCAQHAAVAAASAAAAAKAEAEATSAKLAAAALAPRPSPPPHPPVPKIAMPRAGVGVDTRSASTQTHTDGVGAGAAAPVDGSNSSDGGGGFGKARLVARACELGMKRGLRMAAERQLEEEAAAAAAAEGQQEGEEEGEEEGPMEQEEEEDLGAVSRAPTREGSLADLQGEGGEGVWRKRARVAEARLEAAEAAANEREREEELSQALVREVSGSRTAEAFAAAVEVDLGGLHSAVEVLMAGLDGGKEDKDKDKDKDSGADDGDGKLMATEGGDKKSDSGAGVQSGSGGNGDSSNHGDSGGGDAGQVRASVTLLLFRLAEATGGVAALKVQLADAIKKTTLGRETREAERVRTAKLVNSLRSEVHELRKRPRTGCIGAQTTLKGDDLRATEALVLKLQRENEDFEVGLETLREESGCRQELATLKAEEEALKAEDDLHDSHVREGSARAYSRRLEGRVAALMAHRHELRQERQVLRAAVRASFRDTLAKEQQRMQMRRTVATQVKCSVCALHGELGAGQDTAATPASPTPPPTPTAHNTAAKTVVAGAAAAAATLRTTNGKGGAQKKPDLYRQAAPSVAATAAAPRLGPGKAKAWRRSEFSKQDVSGAACNGNGNRNGSGQAPGVIEGSAGGIGDGDGDVGNALPDSNRNRTRDDGYSEPKEPRGRGFDEGIDDDGDIDSGDIDGARACGGVLARGRRREGRVAWGHGGGGRGGREEAEEPVASPPHSSSSSSPSSSSTSGILVRRGLKAGGFLADCARHRRSRREKLRLSASSSHLPRVDVPLLLAEDGVIRDLPLGVVAARVQQQRFGHLGQGIRENGPRRTAPARRPARSASAPSATWNVIMTS